MNYYSHYQSSPIFPYKKTLRSPNSTHCMQQTKSSSSKPPLGNIQEKSSKQKNSSTFLSKILPSLSTALEPIEKILGRKIEFDDILLVVLIYVIFTEKEGENNTLLCCLLFILLG